MEKQLLKNECEKMIEKIDNFRILMDFCSIDTIQKELGEPKHDFLLGY